jgi:hypothetical protein
MFPHQAAQADGRSYQIGRLAARDNSDCRALPAYSALTPAAAVPPSAAFVAAMPAAEGHPGERVT